MGDLFDAILSALFETAHVLARVIFVLIKIYVCINIAFFGFLLILRVFFGLADFVFGNETFVEEDHSTVELSNLNKTKSESGQFPAVAALLRRSKESTEPLRSFCSATLIAPDTILTAAHCLVDDDGKYLSEQFDLFVSFSHAPNDGPYNDAVLPQETYPIHTSTVHERYEKYEGTPKPQHLGACSNPLNEQSKIACQAIKWCFANRDTETYDDCFRSVRKNIHNSCVFSDDDNDCREQTRAVLGLGRPAHSNDVGIAILASPVLNRTPAKLLAPKSSINFGQQKVSFAGYGVYHMVIEPWREIRTGQKYHGTAWTGAQSDFEIEILPDSTEAQKCFGDSGSPTFLGNVEQSQATPIIVGIASRNVRGPCRDGSIESRSDSYFLWVSSAMQEYCILGVRDSDICQNYSGPPGHYGPAEIVSKSYNMTRGLIFAILMLLPGAIIMFQYRARNDTLKKIFEALRRAVKR